MTKKDIRTHADRKADKTRYTTRKTRAYALVNRLAREAGVDIDEYLDSQELEKPETVKDNMVETVTFYAVFERPDGKIGVGIPREFFEGVKSELKHRDEILREPDIRQWVRMVRVKKKHFTINRI